MLSYPNSSVRYATSRTRRCHSCPEEMIGDRDDHDHDQDDDDGEAPDAGLPLLELVSCPPRSYLTRGGCLTRSPRPRRGRASPWNNFRSRHHFFDAPWKLSGAVAIEPRGPFYTSHPRLLSCRHPIPFQLNPTDHFQMPITTRAGPTKCMQMRP
jgi:hypothetical protein